jgi:HD-GYP domain-containing protein (c-di-GMP phosphodiesterase class II)
VETLLRQSPGVDGRLACSDLSKLCPPEAALWPASAAIVRISRHFDTWLAAVRFNPEHPLGHNELRFMGLARRMLLHQREQLQLGERQKQTLFEMVHAFTASIDAKDPYTCGHSERVGRIAVRIAQEMRLPEKQASDLYLAGLLHDIGKIGVPDAVLRKPAGLSEAEFALIKQHPVTGDQIVTRITQFKHLSAGVRNHHERYDGQGYPDGLAGDEIPLMARILAVADSCDAMMSERPYRPGMVPKAIDDIMTRGAGSQWDPTVVKSFLHCRREIYSICQKGLGQSVRRAIEVTMNEDTAAQGSLSRSFESEARL